MPDDDAWEQTLRAEFDAEPGSFLLSLRVDLRWDADAFDRLVDAMTRGCRAVADADTVPRWMAEGFWYVSWFAASWTAHDAWADRPDRAEIDAGLERLHDLAWWFFVGEPIDGDEGPASEG